jgi:regulator of protease activity HflC (stomatin/prohibitin superfamily)
MIWAYTIGALILAFILMSIRIIRPDERGLIERFGKYKKFSNPGFHWIIPIIDRMLKVDITENMVDCKPQEVITQDNLNATVDLQVYFQVKQDEQSVKKSKYNVQNYTRQIVALARTTARNIIGNLPFAQANSDRNAINQSLQAELDKQTDKWGINIVRVEMKEIQPPKDVQDAMNKVVTAEQNKIAAKDFATAKETEADGVKRAEIKEAEGRAQAVKVEANAKAKAIEEVNLAAQKFFVGDAQVLKKLEVTENSLKNNSKIVLAKDGDITLVLNEGGEVIPLKRKK